MAFVLGGWLYSAFVSGVGEFARVVPVSAYVDVEGGFLVCVRNEGPHVFYGFVVVSYRGESVSVQSVVAVGEVGEVRGVFAEGFVMGTNPVLYVVTGGGSSYPVVAVVVSNVSVLSCK